MSNQQKDYVSDYFREYPVLRYIMPSIIVGGNNITDRVFMLRQAMWVMIQIIRMNDNSFVPGPVTGAGAVSNPPPGKNHLIMNGVPIINSYPIDVDAFGLTKEDIALLGIFLNIAKNKFNSLRQSDRDGFRYEIEAIHKDVGSNFTAPPGAPAKQGPRDYNELLIALSDEIGNLDKINRLIDLIEVTSNLVANAPVAVPPNPSPHPLYMSAVPPVAPPRFNTIPRIAGFHVYGDRSYHTFDIYDLYTAAAVVPGISITPANTWELLENTVTEDVSGTVHLVASRCSNSFFGAQIKNIEKQTGITYQFTTDKNGLLQLNQYNGNTLVSITNYGDLISKITKDDKCKAFGASGRHGVCSTMIADCLGDLTHDEGRCRIHFQRLPSISKNILGWGKLKPEEKKYFAYRVLLGLGIFTQRDKDGNPTYLDNNNLIYSDAHIISTLNLNGTPANGWYNAPTDWNAPAPVPGTPGQITVDQLNAEKVEYIKKMMYLVGIIKLPAPSVAAGRPAIQNSNPASNSVLLGAFMPAFPLILRPMIGGEDESNIKILYGGNSEEDMLKIQGNIRRLLELSKSAINEAKVKYIEGKLNNFTRTARDINEIEKILTSHIILKNRYPNKQLIFTEADIQNLQETEALKKKQFANRYQKMNNLHTKLLQIRN